METYTDSSSASDEARAKLVDASGAPTPHYLAYLKYQKEYNNRVSEQQVAYADAQSSPLKLRMWPILGKQYSDQVSDAMKKWVALGYKNEIDTALNTLRSFGVDTDPFTKSDK